MDDLGPIEIEFIINNAEVTAQAAQAEQTLQDVTTELGVQAQKASAVIIDAQNNQFKAIERLRIELAQYKVSADLALDPASLIKYNQQAEQTAAEITRLSNLGKTGFDELGNAIPVEQVGKFGAAISRATDLNAIGGRVVQMFSRQLIGLATGFLSFEIGAKAIESLIAWIQKLNANAELLDQTKQNMLALNEVMTEADKDAAKQIVNAQLLYNAATDVTSATNLRVEAAQKLKATYPDEFANLTTLAIINGQAKKSFDDLTDAMLKQAQAASIIKKLGDITDKELDLQYQIDKNNAAKFQQTQAINGNTFATTAVPGTATASIQTVTPQQQAQQIKFNTDALNEPLLAQQKVLDGTKQWLLDYGKQRGLVGDLLNKPFEIKDPLAQFDAILKANPTLAVLDDLKKALQDKLDALAPNDSQIATYTAKIKQIDDLEKQYQVKPTNTQDPSTAILASQTNLLQKIQALKDEYASKDKSKDQQQIDAVKAKYQAIYDAIVAQNVKYQNYLKTHTPAQASAAGLQYIDPNSVKTDETNAEAGVMGQQALEQTKNQLDQEKVLFQAYQDFKLKAGTDAANQLYGNDLKGYTTYLDYLKSLQPTEADLTSADPFTKARANALNDYLKVTVPKEQADELKQSQKHLQDLIVQDQSYQQQKETLITRSNDDIKTLTAAGFTEQANVIRANLVNQLTDIETHGFETQAQYKQLYTNITQLSVDAAKQQIASAEATADALHIAGLLTDDAYKKIITDLEKLKESVNDRAFDKIGEIGTSLSQLGQQLTSSGSAIGSYVSALGSLASGLKNVGNETDKLNADLASGADTFGDYTSLATTAVSSIVSIISSVTDAAAARKKAAEDYYNSVISFQQQYNVALDEQVRLQYQTSPGSIFYTDYAQELSDAAKAFDTANNQYKQSLIALQQGQAIVNQKNVINGAAVAKDAASGAVAGAAIGSVVGVGVLSVPAAAVGAIVGGLIGGVVGLFAKKTKNVLTPLLQQYPQLIQANGQFNESLAKTLVANNQVDDATKTLLNNTIAYYDEEKTALDQITAALTDLVGQLGSNIQDALVGAFENGTDAAKAFQQAVSDILDNIIQQDLFVAIFGDQLAALQTKLTADALSNDGNTQAEIISDITDFYKNAGALIPEYTAGLKAAQAAGAKSGLSLFPPSTTGTSTTTISGQISGITADQANLLDGAINGLRLTNLEGNDILTGVGASVAAQTSEIKNQTIVQMQIQVNTKRTADNTDAMKASLQNIDSNTSSSNLTNVLRAAGK